MGGWLREADSFCLGPRKTSRKEKPQGRRERAACQGHTAACCGRWTQGPPRRSEAWAVVVGGDRVHWAAQRRGPLRRVETRSTVAAQRRGLLWSVETRLTAPLRGLGCCGWWTQGPLGPLRGMGCCGRWRQSPLRRPEAWAVVAGGDKAHWAAQGTGLLVCGDRVRRVQFWLRLVSIWARNGWRRDRTEN